MRIQSIIQGTLLLLLLFLNAACSDNGEKEQADASEPLTETTPDEKAIAANNHGAGLMGRFEYAAAVEAFSRLTDQYPDWTEARINLAIAYLNRQQDGDENTALEMVDDVLAAEPENLRANYIAGLLRLYLSSPAEAMEHFRRVAEADDEDAYAAYYLAQCLAQLSDHEQALQWYQKALQLDPYLRSAYYGAFQSMQRLGKTDAAREMVRDYQRLADNPRARLAEFKYTRMGPKGGVVTIDLANASPGSVPAGPVFSEVRELPIDAPDSIPWRSQSATGVAGITVADMQGDGLPDLFIPAALDGDEVHNLVLQGQKSGAYTADLTHPLSRVGNVNAALWGDYDNDGLTDVYLCRNGENQLWRQVEAGRWEDVTQSTGTSGGEHDTRDGAIFDADHDGDLDLFLVNSDGPNELLNNNLDGTFRTLAAEQGIDGGNRASRSVLPVDIDRDRDVDIIVINAEPPHEVYINDRLWAYHDATGFDRFREAPASSIVAGDLDADGAIEIFTATPDGTILRWQADDQGEYQPDTLADTGNAPPGWTQLAILDVNGDGALELLAATPQDWAIVSGSADYRAVLSSGERLAGTTPFVSDPGAGPAMIGMREAGGISVWPPGPGRFPYLAITLSGREEKAESMRSNASGIGALLSIRQGSTWTLTSTFRDTSGPGQSLQPLAIGTGGNGKVDFISIDWSDGVFQSEVELAAGQRYGIAETQRQLSSCPVLFAWDGKEFAFVSDLLGVGGIGFAIGPGEYAASRPRESFLLPEGLLQPGTGSYRLRLSEPMEEVLYLDSARLVAYDVADGWELVLDERMGVQGPEPTGAVLFYRDERLPAKVVNDRGEDVTGALRRADGRAAPVGALDRRFIGRLQREHVLTLDFAGALEKWSGDKHLVIDGWVEYPYSQTSFAAWQAGASFDAPTLEAQGRDGKWRTLLTQFGYPAGMPRRMSVPLADLPDGTRMLRLRTNMEVYWDRIAVVRAEENAPVHRRDLGLKMASVAKTGFPKRTTGSQRRPDYDYGNRRPFWDTRYMAGYYTRIGPVEELVSGTDDAVAIIGPGEEIRLEFEPAGTSPPPGWTRHFVLETNGWTKDMDLFTRDGETVEPLPDTGKPPVVRDRLHARYNTRYQAGR